MQIKNKNLFKVGVTKKEVIKCIVIFLVITLAMVWIIPFVIMFITSFKSLGETFTEPIWNMPKEWHPENYKDAFDALEFGRTFLNSVIITIGSNLLIMFFSSLAAWQLLRMKKWYSTAIFYTLLITMIVPFQAVMIPLVVQMRNMNMMNMLGLIMMYGGFGIAQSTFMMHGFLKTVPISLEEVAKVEGYNPIRVYFKVILPLLKPIIVTMFILNTMWIWNDYLLPYLVFLDNRDVATLPVMLNTNLIGTFGTRLNILMAGLTILIIPAITFFFILQKQIIGGITNGAVK